MYINEIIWSYNRPTPTRLTNNHNTILLYSKGKWKWPPPTYHPQTLKSIRQDERGEYYNKSGTVALRMAENSLSSRSKLDSRDIIYKDGKIYGMKVRRMMSETRYLTSFKTGNNKSHYPTEKPFKLLERIIMLSTKCI